MTDEAAPASSPAPGYTSGVVRVANPRVYPLPRASDDPRFTMGLVLEVRRVLTAHGYPQSTSGLDLVELQLALFGYLYGDRKPEG